MVRRLVGLVLVVLAVAIYLDGAERATFTCERASGTCVHTVERLHRAADQRTFPIADVLGAGSKWSYWDVAPDAHEHLARARSMADVDASKLYTSAREQRRTTSSIVIFTRQGVVPMLPGFVPGSVDVEPLEQFVAGRTDRAVLVQDERLGALPLPAILLALGAFLLGYSIPSTT
jgi:hypothetical protein